MPYRSGSGAPKQRGHAAFLALPILLSVFGIGCSTLTYVEDDTPQERRAKITRRVLLGIFTLGISEAFVHPRENRIQAKRDEFRAGVALTEQIALAKNVDRLTRLFGVAPSCEDLNSIEKVCTWHVDTRMYGTRGRVRSFSIPYGGGVYSFWTVFATQPVLIGGYEFTGICTLRRDGSDREPGSCDHSTDAGMRQEGYLITCRNHPIYCPAGSMVEWRGRRYRKPDPD